jgi:hypothetical protein
MTRRAPGIEGLLRYNRCVCTVTWHDAPAGYQIFFHRDERRERRPALPPEIRRRGGTRFIAPLDGDFGGTWIAVNEFGLSVCLLNGFPAPDRPAPDGRREYTTRGCLPLEAIEHPSPSLVPAMLHSLDLDRFRPFVLVTFAPGGAGSVARWSGVSLDVDDGRAAEQPLVSSSFFTGEVRRNRTAVFADLRRLRAGSDPTSMHLAFHRSHHPTAGAHSPCMHRPEACTVSFGHVRVDDERVHVSYVPHSPCRGMADATTVVLERRAPS